MLPNLIAAGPHHFGAMDVGANPFGAHALANGAASEAERSCGGGRGIERANRGIQMVMPPAVAVVIHYESTSFVRWLDKFTDYARRMRDEGAAAIKLARQFSRFYRVGAAAAATPACYCRRCCRHIAVADAQRRRHAAPPPCSGTCLCRAQDANDVARLDCVW